MHATVDQLTATQPMRVIGRHRPHPIRHDRGAGPASTWRGTLAGCLVAVLIGLAVLCLSAYVAVELASRAVVGIG